MKSHGIVDKHSVFKNSVPMKIDKHKRTRNLKFPIRLFAHKSSNQTYDEARVDLEIFTEIHNSLWASVRLMKIVSWDDNLKLNEEHKGHQSLLSRKTFSHCKRPRHTFKLTDNQQIEETNLLQKVICNQTLILSFYLYTRKKANLKLSKLSLKA